MIKFSDFSFGYDYKQPFEKRIFTDVNVVIDGHKTLLVGPSGSGKSTFFKTIIKHIKPSSGTIDVPDKVGFLLQNVNSQIICQSIYDEINLGYKNTFNTNIDKQVIEDFFTLFNVDFDLNKNPRHLSGGQKKIVILIAILVTKPKLLILDEPFVGLDYKRRSSLVKYLADIETDFILSSHDLEGSSELFDQVVLIENMDIKKVDLEEVYDRRLLKRPV